MAKFTRAPAGTKNHHAYHGGLLEHVVNLMEVVLRVSPCYPQIDRDLLLMGAFLHDLGKIDELSYDRGLSYSDEGQLIGHWSWPSACWTRRWPRRKSSPANRFPRKPCCG